MKISFKLLAAPFLLFCMMNLANYCQAQKPGRNGGVMMQRYRFAAPATGMVNREPQPWDCRVWYHNGMVIQEVKKICTRTAVNGEPVLMATTDHYLFTLPGTSTVNRYPTFTDTAKTIVQAITADSNCTIGYRKLPAPEELNGITHRFVFSDTMISGILYCRAKTTGTINTERGAVEKTICIYQHDEQNEGLFSPGIWRKILPGSPLLWIETTYYPPVYAAEREEYICLNQALTRHELKVFAAWKRKAKMHQRSK